MDDALPPTGSVMGSQLDMDFDLMEEFFFNWDWTDVPESSNLSPVGDSLSANAFHPHKSSLKLENLEHRNKSDQEKSDFSPYPSSSELQAEGFAGNKSSISQNTGNLADCPIQTYKYGNHEPSRRNLDTVSSMKDRLNHAVRYIKESHKESDVLIQIWVPAERGDSHVLTTCGQPFWLDLNCQRLVDYRTVSTNYYFSADANSNEAPGLPGRVFLGKVPEWTPDVRFFSSDEYPRVGYAQHFDVRGSVALPVFDRGSKSCLGVVELVMTTQKINYSSDLVNICNALQAVDLGSSEVLNVPHVKVRSDSYQAALPEIQLVLKAACGIYKLPLAQIWIPCGQQEKGGSRHSTENYKDCVSTVDVACYVNDPCVLDFHKACSEHHLFKGQGVAGKAFTTNQPCFSSDVTAFSRTEYPLSHHARMFNLRGAVAIRLQSILTGTAEFVLEFFLPIKCVGVDEQKLMLSSLSSTIQQLCWSLRVVTAKEMEDEMVMHDSNLICSSRFLGDKALSESKRLNREESFTGIDQGPLLSGSGSSWNADTMVAQQKDTNIIPPRFELDYEVGNAPGFTVTTEWNNSELESHMGKTFSELKQNHQDLLTDTDVRKKPTAGELKISKRSEATDKRRVKTDKSISLQVLQQHFAGSLKDAAKSIGVCPTTLKRICRQHGITRWPSRKIKKVSHSLKKLQVVIDSVQGAEGTFPLGSLYANFSEAPETELVTQNVSGNSTSSTLRLGDQPDTSDAQNGPFTLHASISCSPYCGRQCSSSSQSSSSGAKQLISKTHDAVESEPLKEDIQNNMARRVASEAELNPSAPASPSPLARTHFPTYPSKQPFPGSMSLPREGGQSRDTLRAKVIYGEEKVRFRLLPAWGFQDLKQEIANRFNIGSSLIDLKYLDDDSEWVLLTCDADLQECIDVYKSSGAHTIKISVHLVVVPLTLR